MPDTPRYRSKVIIQATADGYNNLGQKSSDWKTVQVIAANCEELSGSEADKGHQVVAGASWKIEARWTGGITTKMRAVNGENTLQIMAVIDPDQRKRKMILMCGELKR